MNIPPYRICLSGGGIKGFAHLGVLEALNERGMLKAVREYIGISAGTLLAFCMCIGCTLPELRRIVLQLDFGLVRDLDPETALNFPETFGIDTGANLTKFLLAVMKGKKLSPTCTFAELEAKRLGPSLRVFATNLNRCKAEEFSAAVSPGIEVCFGVQASMSIPVYFTPLQHPVSSHLYLDGGIMCSSPFLYLPEEEKQNTLNVIFGDAHKPREKIETLFEFLSQVYYSMDFEYSLQQTKGWEKQTISVPCHGINTTDFEAGPETKEEIMWSGYRAAQKFLRAPGPPPVRRFSTP